jgi:hypothetical protein
VGLKSLTRSTSGTATPSTLLPARNESNAAEAEQNPGPPSAITMTLPS